MKRVIERYHKEFDSAASTAVPLDTCRYEISDPLNVDAQTALIEEMENLLDVIETLVVEELRVTRSLLELPVWGSPRDLVAALANGREDDNSD
ncbi:hypothetical protein QJS10_CPA07g00512 [Acorus calamus]|uniref:Uncharacterized protein n=1 Tax=Acorus calamus TaxID=4465 RepID=A0AAV9EIA1_ACOCL|nr:hypothetical protein QJS10_CPA07g00512 [Acorus calamus]